MNKTLSGIELLKNNFEAVETKFMAYFEEHEPRWPSEKRDYLRNHHQSFAHFLPSNLSLDRLKINGLPDNILQELNSAYAAFERGEEYA